MPQELEDEEAWLLSHVQQLRTALQDLRHVQARNDRKIEDCANSGMQRVQKKDGQQGSEERTHIVRPDSQFFSVIGNS